MSNIQSYNALIDRFKAFASGHFILKRFSHGQIEVSDLEKFGEYPFMHVVPSNVTYAKGMKTFSFQIVLADMPRDKEDKTEYQREVLSDLQRIAEDLVAEITNHRVLFGDLITVNNVSLEPFLEEFQHTLTGWTVSLDLLVPYYWDACSIPAEWNDFFESGSGGTGSILTFIDSITRDENGNVSLVNDEATPSPNYYYGTNDEGVRGWYLLSDEVGLTCETIGDCQTIIDIEAAIDLLQQDVIDLNADVALKANTADISAVGFSNDYNDLDNKPTIPPAITNTSELVNDGEDGVNPFITAQDLPDTSGFVPYTGATQNVDLGTHTLSAKDLVINHSSGSGVAASITKGGAGEALTVNKTSGSGNAMSVTGGVTQLDELHLTTDLADAYIASAATWNAKVPSTRTLTINGTTQDLSADRTFTIATGLTVGTTPITSGTVGRVLFEGTGNVLQQSTNLFWDNANNRLGVGTSSPTNLLTINGDTFGSGHFLLNSQLPSRHTQTVGFKAFWPGANSSLMASTAVGFEGWTLNANLVRAASGWRCQDNTKPAWHMFALSGTDVLGVERSPASDSGSIPLSRLFSIYGTGNVGIGTTTDAGFKLDVNGTARIVSDARINGLTVGRGGGLVVGNTAVGFEAALNNTTGNITAFGYQAGRANTTASDNVAFGYGALRTNSTGSFCLAFGTFALRDNTAGNNVAIGTPALLSNTTGSQNCALGNNSLRLNLTGNNNVAVGNNALRLSTVSNNVAIGYGAGWNDGTNGNTTGANNIFIGWNSIGVSATESNRTWIGNSSTTTTWLGGNLLLGTTTNGASRLRVVGLPTSSAGLSAGDVWNDGGTLKIV